LVTGVDVMRGADIGWYALNTFRENNLGLQVLLHYCCASLLANMNKKIN